jgi:hypothetical protein
MPREECPHCGNWLSRRQIAQHLKHFERDLNLSSSDEETSDNDANMNDKNEADAADMPGAIPGVVDNPGAVDNLGADGGPGSESDHDNEGTYPVP